VRQYTIGQLAAAAGVQTSTVRFYEREGLLKPEARTGSNYRAYGEGSLEKLKFIRAAQASGFHLSDVREMLALTHSDDAPCRDVEQLIERRLADVRTRMTELKRVERVLDTALKNCCRGGVDWCGEIDRLRGRPPHSSCSPAGGNCPPKKSSKKSLTLH
jgi:MerR family mercuric resistance operon transcriptional regulator